MSNQKNKSVMEEIFFIELIIKTGYLSHNVSIYQSCWVCTNKIKVLRDKTFCGCLYKTLTHQVIHNTH